MKAIALKEPGKLEQMELKDEGILSQGEVKVDVLRIGVCGTDIHAFHGRQPYFTYPRILGHELAVRIVDVGVGVAKSRIGEICTVEPYMHCGQCSACLRGKTNCCEKMRVLGVHIDGGMRQSFKLPAQKCHASRILSADQLALVETLAIGYHAVQRGQISSEDKVLVIGAGPIGLSVIQFAQASGASVAVMDVNASRLNFCCKRLGVKHLIEGHRVDSYAQIQDCLYGTPTAVFDATGNAASMERSFDYPVNGGRLIFVGLLQGKLSFDDPSFHRKELTLLASRNALSQDFPKIINLIESGQIDTTPWITHRCDFEDVPLFFHEWTKPETGVVKAMINAE